MLNQIPTTLVHADSDENLHQYLHLFGDSNCRDNQKIVHFHFYDFPYILQNQSIYRSFRSPKYDLLSCFGSSRHEYHFQCR